MRKIFIEQVPAFGKRPQLEAALDFIRRATPGRYKARSPRPVHQHLLEIAERPSPGYL
jgi:hypothetical protein